MLRLPRRGRPLAGVALAVSTFVVLAAARPYAAPALAPASPDTARFAAGTVADWPAAPISGPATDPAEPTRSAADIAAIALIDRLSDDATAGRSGRLQASVIPADLLAEILPADAAELLGLGTAGVHTIIDPRDGSTRTVMTLVPFSARDASGKIGSYRIGRWKDERKSDRAAGMPAGFIKVTAENADTRVSEHFRLRDFLTKDQANVWPKYLVLRMDLVDKLELMIDELRLMGHEIRHVQVMSGFRTPQYNSGSVNGASESRHQYGDAADIFIDNRRAGRMDDLTRDGRIDIRDARVIAEAAERVERKHPSLVGGVGVYPATSAHPPFVHVDVRGTRARWGSL